MPTFGKNVKIYPLTDTTLAIDSVEAFIGEKGDYEEQFGRPLTHGIVVSYTLADNSKVILYVYETKTAYVVRNAH